MSYKLFNPHDFLNKLMSALRYISIAILLFVIAAGLLQLQKFYTEENILATIKLFPDWLAKLATAVTWPIAILLSLCIFRVAFSNIFAAFINLLDRKFLEKVIDAKLGITTATPEQQNEKLFQTVQEVKPDPSPKKDDNPKASNSKLISTSVPKKFGEYILAERLALGELSKELKISFRQDMLYKGATSVVFDGYASEGDSVHIVYIKPIIKGAKFPRLSPKMLRLLSVLPEISREASKAGKKVILYYLAVKMAKDSLEVLETEHEVSLKEKITPYIENLEIRYYDLIDLEKKMFGENPD